MDPGGPGPLAATLKKDVNGSNPHDLDKGLSPSEDSNKYSGKDLNPQQGKSHLDVNGSNPKEDLDPSKEDFKRGWCRDFRNKTEKLLWRLGEIGS